MLQLSEQIVCNKDAKSKDTEKQNDTLSQKGLYSRNEC